VLIVTPSVLLPEKLSGVHIKHPEAAAALRVGRGRKILSAAGMDQKPSLGGIRRMPLSFLYRGHWRRNLQLLHQIRHKERVVSKQLTEKPFRNPGIGGHFLPFNRKPASLVIE